MTRKTRATRSRGARGRKASLIVDYTRAGRQALREERFEDAIQSFRSAIKQHPQDSRLYINLAHAFFAVREFNDARASIQKAREHANDGAVLAEVARTAEFMKWPADALEAWKQAIQIEKRDVVALTALARLFERLNHLEDAEHTIHQALKLDPSMAEALIIRAVLNQRRGDLDAAESDLRVALSHTSCKQSRVDANYTLAAVLDRKKDAKGAMAALATAKQLTRSNARYLRQVGRDMQLTTSTLADQFESGQFRRWRNDGPPATSSPPLAVLCGHPRSGTTLLERSLDAHDHIISAEETPVMDAVHNGIFTVPGQQPTLGQTLDAVTNSDLQELRQSYLDEIERTVNEQIGERTLLDKHPQLILLLPTINRVFPNAKALIAMRDPRDVCLSCYFQNFPLNPVSSQFLSMEDTVTQYVTTMSFWIAVREMLSLDWHELRYEDFVTSPAQHLRKVIEFLGLPWQDETLTFHERSAGRYVSTPSYQDVAKPIYAGRVARWKQYSEYFEPYFNQLNPVIGRLGYEIM